MVAATLVFELHCRLLRKVKEDTMGCLRRCNGTNAAQCQYTGSEMCLMINGNQNNDLYNSGCEI